jgi:uncharacterized protein involved in outer membrane biogenesis
MSRVKRMVRAGLVGLALLTVVLTIVAFVATRLVGREQLRDRITAELSQRTGATVRCEALGLSLLPFPSAVLRGVNVSVPGRIDASIKAVSVAPRLLPLLRGKLQLDKVRIEAPEVTVQPLPPAAAGTGSPAGLAAAVDSALGDVSLAASSPAASAAVVVHGGTLTLPVGKAGVLRLGGIDAQIRLPPARLGIGLRCTSNAWKRLSLHASTDASGGDLSGRCRLFRRSCRQACGLATPRPISWSPFGHAAICRG